MNRETRRCACSPSAASTGSGETPDYDGVTLPSGIDAVLTVGDVVHQIRPADVEAGREFYSRFGDPRRPTYAVPGNHDPAGDHRRLIPDGVAAEVVHDRVVSPGEIVRGSGRSRSTEAGAGSRTRYAH